MLGRLPKPEPKPRFFWQTEPKRNRGFRRPMAGSVLAGQPTWCWLLLECLLQAYSDIFYYLQSTRLVGLAALKTTVKAHLQNRCMWRRAGSMNESRQSL